MFSVGKIRPINLVWASIVEENTGIDEDVAHGRATVPPSRKFTRGGGESLVLDRGKFLLLQRSCYGMLSLYMEDFEAVIAPRIILSDRVIREEGSRKLSLIGCFDALFSPTFPFIAGPFFATVGISNIVSFPNELNVVVRVETSTGHVVASSAVLVQKVANAPPPPRNAPATATSPRPPPAASATPRRPTN